MCVAFNIADYFRH